MSSDPSMGTNEEASESNDAKVSFQLPPRSPKAPTRQAVAASPRKGPRPSRLVTALGKRLTIRSSKKKRIDLATGRFVNRQQHIQLIDNENDDRQFRIHSSATTNRANEKARFRMLDSTTLTTWTADYLRWTFQTSFLTLFASVYAVFLIIVVVFAAMIHGAAYYQPSCVFGDDFDHFFMDAMHLSWTTLSTVGYGVISPQLSQEDSSNCIVINAFMAYEAFLGVIFGSVTGAIIFGKIARNQTVGAINFSNPVCIVYGEGVNALNNKGLPNDSDSDDDEDEIPCPVLLLRMSNQLDKIRGGALVDASVSVVAITPVEKVNTSKPTHSDLIQVDDIDFFETKVKKGPTAKKASLAALKATRKTVTMPMRATGNIIQKVHKAIAKPSPLPFETKTEPYSSADVKTQIDEQIEQLMALKASHEVAELDVNANATLVVEGDSSSLVPARLFHDLNLETNAHPYFQRTWIIRHELDEKSPLLKEEARRRIQENHGYWPKEWNNHESVREQILLSTLIVSVSGTNRGSGSTVYAHKLYKNDFLKVGYDFVTMLHVSEKTGEIHVDHSLLNDVREQKGGGGAPLLETHDDVPAIVTASSALAGDMVPPEEDNTCDAV